MPALTIGVQVLAVPLELTAFTLALGKGTLFKRGLV